MALIPVVNNLEQLRKRANALIEGLQAAVPEYAGTLPDAADEPDGKLFVDSDDGVIYQKQGGAWVPIVGGGSRVRAQASGGNTVSSGNTVAYPTETYDRHSEYNTATSTFTALRAGYYRLYASMKATSVAAGKYISLQVDQSGATVARGPQMFNDSGGARAMGCDVTATLALTAGQTLKVQLLSDEAGALTIDNGLPSYIEIQQV